MHLIQDNNLDLLHVKLVSLENVTIIIIIIIINIYFQDSLMNRKISIYLK